MPKILAIAGSLRKNAYSKRVLNIAIDGARDTGAEVTLVDLGGYPMPFYNADDHAEKGFDPNALRFQGVLKEHDGLIISTPEYNGSIPGGMKNAIDWASRPSEKYKMNEVFAGKTAAMIASSPGSFGGLRCLAHLRGVLTIMGVNVLPMEIAVSFVGQKFDGDGTEMTDEKTKAFLESIGAELTKALS